MRGKALYSTTTLKMTYAHKDKDRAEALQRWMTFTNPCNRYVVAAHSWNANGEPLTWGVTEFVPYHPPTTPERLTGFVRWNYESIPLPAWENV